MLAEGDACKGIAALGSLRSFQQDDVSFQKFLLFSLSLIFILNPYS